ncbi:MAG TPA: efflux transporter outer membrane subunit [Candidatus Omnitrophota bacterium]|nr:efflux transporter outer membrane subunit [Candidatus Omnitrophota bacterium]HPT39095.1 efflux transporter outer membrane subunit [Candidatus Omnitrophota bacterium]
MSKQHYPKTAAMIDCLENALKFRRKSRSVKLPGLKTSGGAVRLFVLFLFVTSASGCSFLAPVYEKPKLPVAESYPYDTVAESVSEPTASAAIGWKDYFLDKKLCAIIEQALRYNRDLRSAVLRVEEACALYGIQRADQFPTINAGASGMRTRTPADLSLTGNKQTSKQFQVDLNSAAWEVDFWGRVRNLKDAALENYLATGAARQAAIVSLIANVANSYLRLSELDERIALTRQTISTREESLRIFKRRFEEGAISRLDVTQVETLLKQAQALGAQLEQERAIEAHFLVFLAGSSLDLAPAQKRLNDFNVLRPLRCGLPSELLINRPDIIAAEHQLRAAGANIGAARAAFFPRVTLIGSWGSASADLEGLFAPESLVWKYGPNISIPIFDTGRNMNNLSLAKARQHLAVAGYEKTVQAAFREVADALAEQKWLSEQVRIQQETLVVQTERARLAQLRYDNGTSAFLEVLDAQRDLLSIEQQLVQTRRALLSSRVRLYAALGGGAQTSVVEQVTLENLSQMKGS